MNNVFVIIGAALAVLVVYVLAVWFIRKWMIKKGVSCFWRSTFLAVFLAPGLILFGDHASLPLPAFAWMSGVSSAYNCIEKGVFCSFKLNLFMSILPFIATWVFAYMMCDETKKESDQV